MLQLPCCFAMVLSILRAWDWVVESLLQYTPTQQVLRKCLMAEKHHLEQQRPRCLLETARYFNRVLFLWPFPGS
uniref:Putative secreted protein n=1 Tax=Ixodes scapularis TaxID=6945 RepID=A0A4D5RX74_IXOSC